MKDQVRANRIKDKIFNYFGILCTLFGVAMLGIFIINILIEGLPRLNWQFLTSLPSRSAARSGILIPLIGSIFIVVLTALIAVPF